MSPLAVRVTVLDTWDEFALDLAPDTAVAEVKRLALACARVPASPDGYMVKFRGALLSEGETTLGQAGVVPNAALIVLPRGRRPAR